MAHEQRRAFQVNQPLYDGRGRGREPYPAGLAPAESAEVLKRGAMLMAFFGYPAK
jgi:hypothetical protein